MTKKEQTKPYYNQTSNNLCKYGFKAFIPYADKMREILVKNLQKGFFSLIKHHNILSNKIH